jgi:hypothetical protein
MMRSHSRFNQPQSQLNYKLLQHHQVQRLLLLKFLCLLRAERQTISSKSQTSELRWKKRQQLK